MTALAVPATTTRPPLDLPRLAATALLVVLLAGAIETGVSWSRCALGHWRRCRGCRRLGS